MHGLLNINKRSGMTSRGVVDHVQALVRPAKCGHAGTLDPLAEGVLVVCIGHATRLIEFIQRPPKSYEATFLLGRCSDTDDTDGRVVEVLGDRPPSRAELDAALPRFRGEIAQRPPDFSAVKVRGRRAYELARRGQSVSLAERLVTVHDLQIVRYEYPELELTVRCGSGTYLRSLGRDLAAELKTHAVMSRLVRTAIGPFRLADAIDLASLDPASLAGRLLPLDRGVEGLPAITVDPREAERICRGQTIHRPHHGLLCEAAAHDSLGQLCAIVVPRDDHQLAPTKVLVDSSSARDPAR